jgi:O-acetyl-ADP-ribose deacetylase (regulator of RNase III)
MSKKALLSSRIKPDLIHCFNPPTTNNRSIEIWTTTCIVTNFCRPTRATILVNPGNPQLAGTRNFPYFPRGGPVPYQKPQTMHKDWQPLGFVSQWGGMEVGTGMLFPVSVVDGLVHQVGGWRLYAECRLRRLLSKEPCPVGHAVLTSAGDLDYDWIVHTTPPFFQNHGKDKGHLPFDRLQSCYNQSMALAFARGDRVAIPLLGAGARGFPVEQAIHLAATSAADWLLQEKHESYRTKGNNQTLVFGLLERQIADELVGHLAKMLQDSRVLPMSNDEHKLEL